MMMVVMTMLVVIMVIMMTMMMVMMTMRKRRGSPVGQIIKRPLGSGLGQHTLTIYSALPRSSYP